MVNYSNMKVGYFIIWFSFNINFRCSYKMMFQGPKSYIAQICGSTPAVWKQYNKMDVLHFFE